MPCARGCGFAVTRVGRKYCCRRCGDGQPHGPLCERLFLEVGSGEFVGPRCLPVTAAPAEAELVDDDAPKPELDLKIAENERALRAQQDEIDWLLSRVEQLETGGGGLPAPSLGTVAVEVVVPEGVAPGQEMAVDWNGATYNVVVPEGSVVGQPLSVELPA